MRAVTWYDAASRLANEAQLLDTLELMLQHSNDRHMIGLSTVLLKYVVGCASDTNITIHTLSSMTISNNDISDLERRCKLALEVRWCRWSAWDADAPFQIVRTSGNDEAVFRSMCAIGTAVRIVATLSPPCANHFVADHARER